jgi:hypothetical protein
MLVDSLLDFRYSPVPAIHNPEFRNAETSTEFRKIYSLVT